MSILRTLLLVMFGGVGALYGQLTQLDLRLQSRDVDFSAASATKPFKSGTGLPSSCGQGEMYYRLDATAGMNVYGCTASNAWTLEQGPPAASMASQLGDFLVTATSATTLAIGTGCSASTPCTVSSVRWCIRLAVAQASQSPREAALRSSTSRVRER